MSCLRKAVELRSLILKRSAITSVIETPAATAALPLAQLTFTALEHPRFAQVKSCEVPVFRLGIALIQLPRVDVISSDNSGPYVGKKVVLLHGSIKPPLKPFGKNKKAHDN